MIRKYSVDLQTTSCDVTEYDLTNELRHQFVTSGYVELSRVTVDLVDESVRLTGIVRTYYLKQKAQNIAMETLPGSRVVNDIEIS